MVGKSSILRVLYRFILIVGRMGLGKFGPARKFWVFTQQTKFFRKLPFGFEAEFDGIKFRMSGPCMYTAHYYTEYVAEGAYEPAVMPHITQVVQNCPNPRILDVGAHYGWYTLYLARLIGNRGLVFAIEPSESVFKILKKNTELNNLQNVRLYKLPLSDKRETANMVIRGRSLWEPRYMAVNELEAANRSNISVRAVTFDELNEKEDIKPNIVKIDVNGVWRKVIEGMKSSILKDVQHLYLELDTLEENLNSQYEDIKYVIQLLKNMDMHVFEIDHFRSKDDGQVIQADEFGISRAGKRWAMLYAVKGKGPY